MVQKPLPETDGELLESLDADKIEELVDGEGGATQADADWRLFLQRFVQKNKPAAMKGLVKQAVPKLDISRSKGVDDGKMLEDLHADKIEELVGGTGVGRDRGRRRQADAIEETPWRTFLRRFVEKNRPGGLAANHDCSVDGELLESLDADKIAELVDGTGGGKLTQTDADRREWLQQFVHKNQRRVFLRHFVSKEHGKSNRRRAQSAGRQRAPLSSSQSAPITRRSASVAAR